MFSKARQKIEEPFQRIGSLAIFALLLSVMALLMAVKNAR